MNYNVNKFRQKYETIKYAECRFFNKKLSRTLIFLLFPPFFWQHPRAEESKKIQLKVHWEIF